jgi:hypothetical protein
MAFRAFMSDHAIMAETSGEWIERQADRSFARQRAQVDTAKLLATFAAGVAAALVATALQVGRPSYLDKVSLWLFAACSFAVIMVVLCDRLTEADHTQTCVVAATNGWDDNRLVGELRILHVAAVRNNSMLLEW